MADISVLSPQIANMIAAGEVVERPSSVIKELIENSIDAGATEITVEIRESAVSYMRVTDNASGMDPQNAQTCFLRHATSKIRYENDLTGIRTLGFRGEALAAIAAVSHVELFTKIAGMQYGTHLVLEAGEILQNEETGCPDGTTIIIKDLFFNTPARMKFLKKDSTEASYIESAVQHVAMSRADISFKIIRDKKQVLNTQGNGSLLAAIYSVYGGDLTDKLCALSGTQREIQVAGFTSNLQYSRSNRAMQNFFVNGRYVQSKLLSAAVEQAYSGRLVHGKFPACFLDITISPSLVDVNVHPAKLEVKFAFERDVFSAVFQFITATLDSEVFGSSIEIKPQETAQPRGLFTYPEAESHVAGTLSSSTRTYAPQQTSFQAGGINLSGYDAYPKEMQNTWKAPAIEQSEVTPEPPQSADYIPSITKDEQKAAEDFTLIGEIFTTYILIQRADEFLLIDKHAAHERMLYNKLMLAQDGTSVQALLSPENIVITRREKDVILQNIDVLTQAGFELEDFGGNSLILRGVPMYVKLNSFTDIITDIAQKLMELKQSRSDALDTIFKSVACRAAVKAGNFTDRIEMKIFVETVLGDAGVRTCPHGRPVIVTLSKGDIEKMFKRIV